MFWATTLTLLVLVLADGDVIADGWYARGSSGFSGELSFSSRVTTYLNVRMFGNPVESYLIDVPAKYPLLLCLIAFGVGFLLYKRIIHVPQWFNIGRKPPS